jgi:beta-galactosidase/beta-glucuronidase
MKKLLSFLFLLTVLGKAQAQVSFGQPSLLNDDWRFLRVDSAWNVFESADMKNVSYDDSNWRTVTLPHDWGVEQPMSPDKGSCQGYLPGGIGWYRKTLPTPLPYKEGQGVSLYFEGIYNHAEVYLNGHLLGMRPSGFASVLYNITPYLNKEGENVIAVRVDHSQEADSRWYTGSGINRNVWLITAPKVHLAQWGTAYRLKSIDKKKAVVEVDIETTDETSPSKGGELWATVELADVQGNVVAKTKTSIKTQEKKTVVLTVKNPQRWTLEKPYLYTLTTKLENGDQSVVKAGLRTLEFSPDRGFALNGEWMKVKGVCVHDDAGILGTAVPKEVWKRRLMELKSIGVNAIRLSHNPHAPEFYDLCDELGLLVMDEASDEWEFPKRKWMKGWNQGRPGYQGTYTYFEQWIDRDVADMVRRDRCHPSIFLWSIGNEVDYPNDPYSHPVLDRGGDDFTQPMYGGYKPDQPNAERIGRIAQRLAKIVKDIDPSRPTTGALAGVVMSNETAYPDAIDVVGYNYTESRYKEDHLKYPNRVIYGSENRHDLPAWRAVSENEHIFGQFLWTGIDYLGESGPWPARGSSAGLLDLAGQRKPQGWYRAALWSDKPVCFIYKRRQGRQTRIVCYTNAQTVKLFNDGQPIGGEPRRDRRDGSFFWELDGPTGTLRCEADNGASYEIKKTGVPHALRLTTDSVAHVFVEVVDEQGNRVEQADNEVSLYVQGARLLGLENGNIMDVSVAGHRQPNRLRTHQGRLVGFIQPQKEYGEVSIRATSPFLPPVEIKF